MAWTRKYPREWIEKVPAEVFACLLPGELRINVLPGNGHVNSGAPWNVPVDVIRLELRMPNTRLWLEFDDDLNTVRAWRREE